MDITSDRRTREYGITALHESADSYRQRLDSAKNESATPGQGRSWDSQLDISETRQKVTDRDFPFLPWQVELQGQ